MHYNILHIFTVIKITLGIMNEANIDRAYRKEKPETITESLEGWVIVPRQA
jgi:hypothetical protein